VAETLVVSNEGGEERGRRLAMAWTGVLRLGEDLEGQMVYEI
jgi:hypothetical protein